MPDYKTFAKELMLLCQKHGVRLHAYHLGDVFLGPARMKVARECFSGFECSPTHVKIGDNDPCGKNIEIHNDKNAGH